MKDQKTFIFLVLCFFMVFSILSCKKEGDDDNGGGKSKVEEGKSTRAKHNNKLMQGVGNVYIADNISKSDKPQLYSRVDYGEDKLTYYVSPLSDKDLGTDHRLVYGALDARQSIIELDEEKRSFRFYTQHNSSRLPLLLDIIQHGNSQYELKLFSVDWDKGSQAILGSVYLRNGQAVGISKQSSIPGNSKQAGTISSSTLGFLGCQRPSKEAAPPAKIGAYLGYIQCFILPLIKDEGGASALFESIRESSENSLLYVELLRDMEAITHLLGGLRKVFGSFHTDPLDTNDPLKSFKWYDTDANKDKSMADVQLSFFPKSSSLEYDETRVNNLLKIALQVQDKDNEPLVDQVVFVDFRVELEQAGKLHLLSEETLSSSLADGQLKFTYDLAGAVVKPKVGDKLLVSYRLSANEEDQFIQHQVKILDCTPTKIEIVRGNEQETSWEEKLKAPLVVKVTNKAGEPIEGVRLHWTLQSTGWGIGVGRLDGTQERTDAEGFAQSDYKVSMQQERLETIKVQVLNKTGNIIPGLDVVFTYKLKRKNYSLIILKPVDVNDMDKWEEIDEWKNGDNVMLYYGQHIMAKLKLDGKILKYSNGKDIQVSLSTVNMHKGPVSRHANHPFQAQDIIIKDCPIRFSDYDRGRGIDSIVVNLTINNQLYRSVVGKTIRAVGSDKPAPMGYLDNYNAGEVVTFMFKADGKVAVNSLKHGQHYNKSNNTYGVLGGHASYAPIYDSQANTNIMKPIVGIIYATPDASSSYRNHSLTCSFILFADNTFTAHNMGTGYRPSIFNAYWKSLKIE